MLAIRLLLLLGGIFVWWPLLILWLILAILPHLEPSQVVVVERRQESYPVDPCVVQPPPILDRNWRIKGA